ITEGTIAKWMVEEGEQVNQGDNIVELETDKVNLEVSAEDTGVLKEIKAQAGDTVEVDEVIGVLDENAEAGQSASEGSSQEKETSEQEIEKPATSEPKEQPETKEEDSLDQPVASPAARKLAREQGIDLSKVQTQDPMGRVRAEDVKNASAKQATGSQSSPAK